MIYQNLKNLGVIIIERNIHVKKILEEKVLFNLSVGDIDVIRKRRKMKIILPHAIHHYTEKNAGYYLDHVTLSFT